MLRFKPVVCCVNCGANLTLGLWDMLPNPKTAALVAVCGSCHHHNRVPYHYSFFGVVLAVLISIVLPANTYRFLPNLLSSSLGTIALCLIFLCFFLGSFYLVFRSYFGLCKKPFVAKDYKSFFFK